MTGAWPAAWRRAATSPTSSGVVGTSMPADTYPVNARAPNRSTCRHITPFGCPVEPDEYMIAKSSSGATATGAGAPRGWAG